MTKELFTSESVTEGHPDKICDQVSDAILDAYIAQDPKSRCAVECTVTENQLMLIGEISSSARVDIDATARAVIADIGYTSPELGFYDGCRILNFLHEQASELTDNVGAGDQGLMFGYACTHTKELMPLPIMLAHKLAMQLEKVRRDKTIEGLLPDGKTQVTCELKEGKPVFVDTVLISTHHTHIFEDDALFEKMREGIKKQVIEKVIPKELLTKATKLHINPLGKWFTGGPKADTGLTGRKIIVDTYGGWARHGGGCFSGKDPTKVDRSATYMARHIAKSIVGSELAEQCEIQLAFEIGGQRPVSLMVDTFGTGVMADGKIEALVHKAFDLSFRGFLEYLDLRRPIYEPLASYGHFGRTDLDLTWEKIKKIG
jgi:S-adenosylmethionine synthetase